MDKFERLNMNLHLNFSQVSSSKVPVTRGSPRIIFLSIPVLSVKPLFKTSKSKAKPQNHSHQNLRCPYSIAT